MGLSLRVCVLILLMSLKIASACLDGECRILAFPAFFFFANKRLKKHRIRTEQVPDLDVCELLCYHEPNCVSVNYEIGTQKCELNNATHRGHDDEFVDEEGYFYHGADSACDKTSCKNGGTCQAGFTDKLYRCVCPSGFSGEHCEKADRDSCIVKQPCKNGGACETTDDGYICRCEAGFIGTNCELVSGFSISSTIISQNGYYLHHLQRYLKPAVKKDSHWVLCYRASEHGWQASTFHDRCDGKKNTVTIIKKAAFVFGGYTDKAWASYAQAVYTATSNSFIFSLKNNENLSPFKSPVKIKPYAICQSSFYGPTFGGGHDIYIANYANQYSHSLTNFGHSYPAPSGVQNSRTILTGSYNFKPDEVEVFYLGPSPTAAP